MSLLALLITAGALIFGKRQQMLEDRRRATQHVVEVALAVVQGFQVLEAKGELKREDAQARATAALKLLRYGGTEYVWVHDLDARMVMHPTRPELDGKALHELKDPDGVPIFLVMNERVRKDGKGFVDYQWPRPGSDHPVPKVSFVQGFAPWGWVVGSGIYVDDVSTAFRADVLRLSVGVLALALLLALGVVAVTRSIVRPLREAMALAERTAAGDLSAHLDVPAEGDELTALLRSLARMQQQLHATVSGLRRVSEVIDGAARNLSEGNQEVEQRTRDQVVRIEETASTLEELSTTVKQNAATAQRVDDDAKEAATVASQGGEAVMKVVGLMKRMTESARRIGDISGVIDEMAFQTNILALNANVEAARAGEHGRGFAVVASEVRSLALRSAASAREIKQLVLQVAQETEQGVAQATEAGEVVSRVVQAAHGLATLVGDISHASQEQSSAINQAASSVTEIDQATQQNADVVHRAATTAQSLSAEAATLARAIAEFQLEAAEPPAPSAPRPAVPAAHGFVPLDAAPRPSAPRAHP
jgi:methyl-accepting chemotaxis protein